MTLFSIAWALRCYHVEADEPFVKWSGKMVIELKYSGTNTYLVRGTDGSVLFDTG